MSSAERAIQNPSVPKYSNIQKVFGRVLDRRSKQREPDCALLRDGSPSPLVDLEAEMLQDIELTEREETPEAKP
jgi:hypothetical protein